MENKQCGKITAEVIGKADSVVINNLFPCLESGELVTPIYLQSLLEDLSVKKGYQPQLLEFFCRRAEQEATVLRNVLIAANRQPVKQGALELKFSFDYPVHHSERTWWVLLTDYLRAPDISRYFDFPYPVKFVRKGQELAKLETLPEPQQGYTIFGEDLFANRTHANSFDPGINVIWDSNVQAFFAQIDGYFTMEGGKLSVYPPFWMSPDRMSLYYINLKKCKGDEHPLPRALEEFLREKQIARHFLVDRPFAHIEPGRHKLLAQGKFPTKGRDAKVTYHFKLEPSIGSLDENGRMNFKEKDFFVNAKEGQLLAVKVLPKEGEKGLNLQEKLVETDPPRDYLLRKGAGAVVQQDDDEMRIYSEIDGIIELKQDTVSVNPTAFIRSNLGLESGNVKTRGNVEVSGSVQAGFDVISSRNIIVGGNVEDGCRLEAGDGILIKGGITGENTTIICEGDLHTKYINAATVVCKGSIVVERFVLGANIECHDTITVHGQKLNLNEVGAVVDCNIKVRNSFLAPVVGSDAGPKTHITFGWNPSLEAHIVQQREALTKIVETMNDIRARYDFDIEDDNLTEIIKDFSKPLRLDILNSIKELRTLQNKYNMMTSFLTKSTKELDNLLLGAYVKITRRVNPTLILHVQNLQKTYTDVSGGYKYYFDAESRVIRRSPFVGDPFK